MKEHLINFIVGVISLIIGVAFVSFILYLFENYTIAIISVYVAILGVCTLTALGKWVRDNF